MMQKLRFTIYHGLAASAALHSALALPLVLRLPSEAPDEAPTLMIELQGVVADTQSEERILQETKGQAQEDEPELAESAPAQPPASETQPMPSGVEGAESPTAQPQPEEAPTPRLAAPKKETPSTAVGSENVKGGAESEKAQTIKLSQEEISRLKEYVKLLTKRVQAHLVYPDEGRRDRLQGTAKVSFRILSNGQISATSLKVVESSGQPELDASALQTVRSSIPFAPPPKEMTVAIAVAFGRKH
ncbi:energy transducer TonB [Methylocapsa polymorpha]|uniref:Energy transducer TonB n=1 Tax=Methylocapsa polymorpha TaxID=3080828 RepID=A0ABZ0HT49_9HYPH|nr:energy transducer TonB [Methylocapsa sp. RX1]